MSQLSLRKLPVEIEKFITTESHRRHITKTQVVIEALRKVIHEPALTEKKRDIRGFFGKMSQREYQAFRRKTQAFEKIEKELWK